MISPSSQIFRQQCVDGEILHQLDEEDLILIPITAPSHRRFILKKIDEYKRQYARLEEGRKRERDSEFGFGGSPDGVAKKRVLEWMKENEAYLSP